MSALRPQTPQAALKPAPPTGDKHDTYIARAVPSCLSSGGKRKANDGPGNRQVAECQPEAQSLIKLKRLSCTEAVQGCSNRAVSHCPGRVSRHRNLHFVQSAWSRRHRHWMKAAIAIADMPQRNAAVGVTEPSRSGRKHSTTPAMPRLPPSQVRRVSGVP